MLITCCMLRQHRDEEEWANPIANDSGSEVK